ncbi:glycosyltransferase [Leucobacter sp. HY1910]
MWKRTAARLLLTDHDLDPGRDDPALTCYDWTGTTEAGVEPLGRAGRPRILVALSSSDWPGMLAVYQRIINAISGLEVDAVVTTGDVNLTGRLVGTTNVDVRAWVDHAEVLPTVDLVVGHGGHSTTMKTLAHGIPLLIMPINPTSDQRIVGWTVESIGAGRQLPKSASSSRIRAEIHTILDDDALRTRAMAVGRRLRAAPNGAEVAADHIVAVLEQRG